MMGGFPRDKVLKLNKSLYGKVNAPRMWYDAECKDRKDIDAILKSFKEDGDKYNWVNSLGDGAYKLTQEGLIDKILKAMGMENFHLGLNSYVLTLMVKASSYRTSGSMLQWLE
eukprot:5088915-Ditylum_brightwellii.AAC.1